MIFVALRKKNRFVLIGRSSKSNHEADIAMAYFEGQCKIDALELKKDIGKLFVIIPNGTQTYSSAFSYHYSRALPSESLFTRQKFEFDPNDNTVQ